MTGNDYVDQAIPHEAGHIVVGLWSGFPIKGMAVEIEREVGRTKLGNFITRSIEPDDETIRHTPPAVLEKYELFVAGGLAGNNFAGVAAEDESLQNDRTKLSRVTDESLEAMAEKAVGIIQSHSESFLKLVEEIGSR